jgi:predicted Zn finger-like uncharacterized protein
VDSEDSPKKRPATLATRCTACGTVFRVVQDQLRVSEGWVRCGRCAEVFNASENLVDSPATLPVPPGPLARVAIGRGAGLPPATTEPAPSAASPLDAELEARTPPPASAADPTSLTPSDFDTSIPGNDEGDNADVTTTGGAGGALPSFVRRADRAARWQQPRVRAALAGLALLALITLAAQVAHSYRDLVAARWPAARPLLVQACAVLDCEVGAPRLIDALVVESSGLVRVEKSRVYKLSVALRNQGALEVALPALDLTLTDTQGRLVARKVLRAADLGVAPAAQSSLGAGRELGLQATLQTPASAPGEAVAGYTIELFYP